MYVSRLWEAFKAWRRGEKRVASGVRGRCYTREGRPVTGPTKTRAKASAKLASIRIVRANGDIEEIKHG